MSSCGKEGVKYHIGFSQCVGGAWREKVNMEMLSAQHLYNNVVDVDIKNADNISERQVAQIDSFVNAGVDILVVAPNDYRSVAPAIVRARKHGIPVVLFDRKANTNDYTAYIGGDNIAAGRAMGNYALSLISGSRQGQIGTILELTGGKASSPAIDRHRGFRSVMKGNKHVDYRFIDTDWTSEENYRTMKAYLKTHPAPDVVFCHSDLAALNARQAAKDMGVVDKIQFLGIDGLPGKGEGIECVANGILAGTYTYPTNGEQIVKLCLDILQGQPYKRDNIMQSVLVTPDNASLLLQTGKEMEQRSHDLLTLQDKIESLFGQYHTQRMLIIISAIAIVLLIVALLLIYRLVVIMRRINHKEKQLNREQTLFYTNARHQLRTPLTLIAGPLSELSASKDLQEHDRTLVDILQRNVEQLSKIVYDVLNFRNDTPPAIDDNNAAKEMEKETASVAADKESARPEKQVPDNNSLPTVLVVDDNEDMRRYIRTLLTDKYYVTEAVDGENGLQVAHETIPDIIVSDVMMPVMDGLEFCRRIKADTMTSHIPVILLTARSTEEQQLEGLGSGADDYMTKPFSAQLLLARIDNLLKSRLKLRHLFNGKVKNEPEVKEAEEKLSPLDRKFIDRLKAAMEKHLSESDVKVDDIGSDIGLSRVQLYRKLKAITGLSPAELLRQMRLQKAHDLIMHSDQPISAIAYDTGFSSPGYFSKCFRDEYGISPSDMRK
ncbi:MAG: substrate-binding domain-containing protein [Prevotella sp.]|nr:substrate-binding domain-containing protein [Prevotella sp.]